MSRPSQTSEDTKGKTGCGLRAWLFSCAIGALVLCGLPILLLRLVGGAVERIVGGIFLSESEAKRQTEAERTLAQRSKDREGKEAVARAERERVKALRERAAWSRELEAKTTRWLAANGLTYGKLRGTDFSRLVSFQSPLVGANFRGEDLRGCNFNYVDLSLADFTDADLRDASLWNASLYGANLTGADLRGADLRNASLKRTQFAGAILRGTRLDGANMVEAFLKGARLKGAVAEHGSWPEGFDPVAGGVVEGPRPANHPGGASANPDLPPSIIGQ